MLESTASILSERSLRFSSAPDAQPLETYGKSASLEQLHRSFHVPLNRGGVRLSVSLGTPCPEKNYRSYRARLSQRTWTETKRSSMTYQKRSAPDVLNTILYFQLW